jgi:hypothetical protein
MLDISLESQTIGWIYHQFCFVDAVENVSKLILVQVLFQLSVYTYLILPLPTFSSNNGLQPPMRCKPN